MMQPYKKLLGLLRVVMGWIFLWAFLDKLLGLGFATTAENSWLAGASPTVGYLSQATHGPLASVFQAMAGHVAVDGLFMLGLIGVGVALILGIGVQVAGYSGALMMLFIYLTRIPPEQNPLVDEHIVYILVLMTFTRLSVGEWFGLGNWWQQLPIVKQFGWLK